MYYDKEYFRFLAPHIRMSAEALKALEAHFSVFSAEEADAHARFLTGETVPHAEKVDRIHALADRYGKLPCLLLYLACAGYTHEKYRLAGIPDGIFYDSMNCIPEKMETHRKFSGEWGYGAIRWPLFHLNRIIFRIGRLSYEMQSIPADLVTTEDLPFKAGDPGLKIHISDNESLTGCKESLQNARTFFSLYYPAYRKSVFLTRTWLLDPRLLPLLSPGSNIEKFQQLFHIYGYIDNEEEVLRRIFGEYKENLAEYASASSLGRAVITHLQEGNHLGSGLGYVPGL